MTTGKYLGTPKYPQKGGWKFQALDLDLVQLQSRRSFPIAADLVTIYAVLHLLLYGSHSVQNFAQSCSRTLLEEVNLGVANMMPSRSNLIQRISNASSTPSSKPALPTSLLAVSCLAWNCPARGDVGDIRVFNREPLRLHSPAMHAPGSELNIEL
jgi:hypothetical protein